ncbi:hypothetical protein EDB85DRAFT_1904934 [Lactarius pseudohatsudake]|nr:hypothetical protein EDB85DRAFT_1904934 [Lactarius pseudohatsudake]
MAYERCQRARSLRLGSVLALMSMQHGEGEQENDKRGGDKKCKGIVHQRGLSMREKGVVDGVEREKGQMRRDSRGVRDSDIKTARSSGLPRKKLEVLYLGNPRVPCHGYGFGTGSESATPTLPVPA